MGTKAYFIRAGLFKDVDVALFAHVGSDLGVSWETAKAPAWSPSSIPRPDRAFRCPLARPRALDAVELMNIGWNYRRAPGARTSFALRRDRRR